MWGVHVCTPGPIPCIKQTTDAQPLGLPSPPPHTHWHWQSNYSSAVQVLPHEQYANQTVGKNNLLPGFSSKVQAKQHCVKSGPTEVLSLSSLPSIILSSHQVLEISATLDDCHLKGHQLWHQLGNFKTGPLPFSHGCHAWNR